jgi:hypothetical protein
MCHGGPVATYFILSCANREMEDVAFLFAGNKVILSDIVGHK